MTDGRLDAVLPLTAADLERARLLFASLDAFFEPLGTCWVVVPDRDVASLRGRLPEQRYELVAESDVVPELAVAAAPPHGWFVQQLVKLAIAERVRTPFYLTLDADVVCVRPVRYEDLVRGGRAVAQTAPPSHPEWTDDAERVLELPRIARQPAVTPSLLSRAAVLELARHLEGRAGGRGWRTFLLHSLPWTEYALYHTFLEGTGRFGDFHVLAGERAIYGDSVWIAGDFDEWDPRRAAASGCLFSVVQSATRVEPERVWERLAPHLSAPPPPIAAAADADEEVERLRAENAALRRRNRELEREVATRGPQ